VAARRLVAALVAAVGLVLVPVAGAGLVSGLVGAALPSCGAVSHPFAQFGDDGSYCALPNSGFESGSAGWTLSGGAAVVPGNEPWHVAGPGASALDLPAGASAISSPVPISLLDPYFRLFARSAFADGPLSLRVVFRGLTGNVTGVLNVTDLPSSSYSDWEPSGAVPSLLALPLGTSSAQLVITSTASTGDWQVDDVFVDPFISRVG